MKTDYEARVLCDSVSPAGHRLTTMEWTFPRFILAEVNTHRMLSRNSASSRAIPVEKRVRAVEDAMFVPEAFSQNQRGMQAAGNIEDQTEAREIWQSAGDYACMKASQLAKLGVHKQHANRLLEPFVWHTAIISATDWDNVWAQRCHPDAQPEFRIIAELARQAMDASSPTELPEELWHMPLVGDEVGDPTDDTVDGIPRLIWPAANNPKGDPYGYLAMIEEMCKISVGRCARVSYLTHDGKRDFMADIELANKLVNSGHMSPFEHVARPMTKDELQRFETWVPETDIDFRRTGHYFRRIGSYLGNFNGWIQFRKLLPSERVFGGGV